MRRFLSRSRLIQAGCGVIVLCAVSTAVEAAPNLTIGSRTGERGRLTSVDVSLSEPLEPYAGVNLRIALPEGMELAAVSPSAALIGSRVQTQALPRGQSVAIVAYTGSGAFAIAGESTALLSLLIRVDSSVEPGPYEISFAESNPDPFVNSRHALSNADGSTSVDHNALPGTLTVEMARGSIFGFVSLPGFGPVEGARVTVLQSGDQVFTDSAGRFQFELRPGEYAIRITDGDTTKNLDPILVGELGVVDLGIIAIPEPATAACGLAAALGLGATSHMRRRNRSQQSS